jgi:hypothetical protein
MWRRDAVPVGPTAVPGRGGETRESRRREDTMMTAKVDYIGIISLLSCLGSILFLLFDIYCEDCFNLAEPLIL